MSNITSTSVLIDWSPPLSHHHNGVIRHYTVTLKEVPTDTVTVFNTSDLFIHIQNLHPYYEYDFDVSAVTIGPGPVTLGTFKLLEDGNFRLILFHFNIDCILYFYSSKLLPTECFCMVSKLNYSISIME